MSARGIKAIAVEKVPSGPCIDLMPPPPEYLSKYSTRVPAARACSSRHAAPSLETARESPPSIPPNPLPSPFDKSTSISSHHCPAAPCHLCSPAPRTQAGYFLHFSSLPRPRRCWSPAEVANRVSATLLHDSIRPRQHRHPDPCCYPRRGDASRVIRHSLRPSNTDQPHRFIPPPVGSPGSHSIQSPPSPSLLCHVVASTRRLALDPTARHVVHRRRLPRQVEFQQLEHARSCPVHCRPEKCKSPRARREAHQQRAGQYPVRSPSSRAATAAGPNFGRRVASLLTPPEPRRQKFKGLRPTTPHHDLSTDGALTGSRWQPQRIPQEEICLQGAREEGPARLTAKCGR